jgi:hypothetical protein
VPMSRRCVLRHHRPEGQLEIVGTSLAPGEKQLVAVVPAARRRIPGILVVRRVRRDRDLHDWCSVVVSAAQVCVAAPIVPPVGQG